MELEAVIRIWFYIKIKAQYLRGKLPLRYWAFDYRTSFDWVLTIIPRERTISKGHTLQLDTITYQTYRNDELVCLPPKTKVLAIQTYTGKLYATDKADDVFELRQLRHHETHSPAFEVIIETPARKTKKKPSVPAITHPWRLMNYRDFLVSTGMNVYEANHVVYQTS